MVFSIKSGANLRQQYFQFTSIMDKTTGLLLTGIIGGVIGSYSYKLYSDKNRKLGEEHMEIKSIKEILETYSNEFNSSGAIEKVIPRQFLHESDLESLTSNLHYRKTDSHLSSLSKSLSNPIYDLLDRGGKRWRPILCMLIAQLYGRKKEEVFEIAALCQIVHNGTLIVDDIEDSSTVRRDKPCVHLLYGVDISVNAGNFMYFAPFHYLLKSKKYNLQQQAKIGQIFAEQMTSLHIGQGWDILWHNVDKLQGKFPTQDHYLQMTAHKTGVLARLSARLVCVHLKLSQKETNILSKFAETMGVAFQIQDDLLNLEGVQYMKTKGYSGEDIHEGKITLMVLNFLNSSAEQTKKDRLVQILKKKTEDQPEIQEAICMMREAGCFQQARKTMNMLIDSAWEDVQKNLPNNVFRIYIKELAEYGVKRTK